MVLGVSRVVSERTVSGSVGELAIGFSKVTYLLRTTVVLPLYAVSIKML